MTLVKVARAPTTKRDLRLWRSIVWLAEPPPEIAPRGDFGAATGTASSGHVERMIFEFDEAYTAYVEGFETLPSEAQMLALQRVDTQVASMVAMKEASLWSEAARGADPIWLELRALAARVLVEFDWPDRME